MDCRGIPRKMNVRKLLLILGTIISFQPFTAHALSLGEMDLRSALNQPLDAEIKLLSPTAAELRDLRVQLAPEEAFARAGIERSALLNQFRFRVVQRADGTHVIKVTSTQPVREPFLDFLLEVNWGSGRFVREYTALLDFPVFAKENAAPIERPSATSSTPTPSAPETLAQAPREDSLSTDAAAPAPDSSAASAQTSASTSASESSTQQNTFIDKERTTPKFTSDSYGPTARHDTLGKVAENLKSGSLSVEQVMVGLLKNNPEAFYRNNINNLKAGYILRLPPPETLQAISRAEASRRVAAQHRAWLAARGQGRMAPLEAGSDDAVAGTTTPSTGRLKLVSADDGTPKSSGGAKTGTGGGGSAAVQRDLALTQDALQAARQENSDLKSRLADLEKQVADMKRLIELKNAGLENLQRSATQNGQSAVPSVPATPGATPLPPAALPGDPAALAPDTGVMPPATDGVPPLEEGATQVPPATTTPPPPAVRPPEPTPSSFSLGDLDSTMLSILAGVVVALVAGLGFLWRRRRSNLAELEEGLEKNPASGMTNSFSVPDVETNLVLGSGAASSGRFQAPANFMGGANSTTEESSSANRADEMTTDTSRPFNDGSQQTVEDVIDPLTEADVYLAYRRYEQAERLIRDAMAHDPNRHELSLKLLEIFYAQRNVDAFETQAEALYAALGGRGGAIWDKVVRMGKELCPEHPLFITAFDNTTAFSSKGDTDVGAAEMSKLWDGLGGESSSGNSAADFTKSFDETAARSHAVLYPTEPEMALGQKQEMDLENARADLDKPIDFSFDTTPSDGLDHTPEPSFTNGSAAKGNLDLDFMPPNNDDEAILVVDDDDLRRSHGDTKGQRSTFIGDDSTFPDSMQEFDYDMLEPEKREAVAGLETDYTPLEIDAHPSSSPSSAATKRADLEDASFSLPEASDTVGAWDMAEPTPVRMAQGEGADSMNDDGYFIGGDMVGTKLDLAKAYIDMGDSEGARMLLEEVVKEGSHTQRHEAEGLLQQTA